MKAHREKAAALQCGFGETYEEDNETAMFSSFAIGMDTVISNDFSENECFCSVDFFEDCLNGGPSFFEIITGITFH